MCSLIIGKPYLQSAEVESGVSPASRTLKKKNTRDVQRTLDEAMGEAGVKLTVEHGKDDIEQLRLSIKNMKVRETEVNHR